MSVDSAPPPLPDSDLIATPADKLPFKDQGRMELVHIHIFHSPENPKDVNGFNFVVRDRNASYTLSIREGVAGDGSEQVPATRFEPGGDEYRALLASRGEALEETQRRILDAGPLLAALVADMKS